MSNAIIEGLECTLYVDYDCEGRDPPMKKLTDNGKIDWLEKRMQMIFLSPLERLYDRNSTAFKELNFPTGAPPMTTAIMTNSLIMNGIDAFGSFMTPRGTRKRDCFFAFMDRYMRNWTRVVGRHPYKGRKLSEILWENFRNSIAHSLAISEAGLEDLPSTRNYRIKGNKIKINGIKFYHDFVTATTRFFHSTRRFKKYKALFMVRFNEVYKC